MISIMVCMGTRDGSEAIHRKARGILSALKVRCELSYSTGIAPMMDDRFIKASSYNVYVLDACSKDCLALAAHIRKNNVQSSILFMNVQRSFDINSLVKYRPSYLVFSPEGEDNLEAGLKRCCSEQIGLRSYFTVKAKESDIRIDQNDILFFESAQRIVRIYTKTNVVEFYAKLSDVSEMLPRNRFVRCHQSYILNMSYISKLDKSSRYFYLVSGKEIPVSKSCYANAVESYETYSSGNLMFS